MDNSVVTKKANLKRPPLALVLSIFLLLTLPLITMSLGLNFNNFIASFKLMPIFLTQTLLHWTGFSLAIIMVSLCITQYKLCKDKIVLIIGFTLLFSALLEVLNTGILNDPSLNFQEKQNINASLGFFSNLFNGCILTIGLFFLIDFQLNTKKWPIIFSSILLFVASVALTYYIFSNFITVPLAFNGFFHKPYELINFSLYLMLLLFLYPRAYTLYPSMLTHCIWYMGLTQIIISSYLILTPDFQSISGYPIAYFLKLLFYAIPFSGLVLNYKFSYSATLNAQKRLIIQQKELKYLASHDALTNLFNRREFEDSLDKTIANALRYNQNLALLLINLDNFKITNDTLGTLQGDKLLKQFSTRLTLLTRKGDVLSRIGGDEFTVISLHLKSPTAARQMAERILNEMNSPYLLKGRLITITVSIGIALFPNDGITTEDLLRKANLALNKSKQSGKNTYQFYTQLMSLSQHREAEIESHLRKALQRDEFELYYQPKYNLLSKKIIGAEILLRWNNTVLGSVSPNEFIPIAENTGLIIDLGYWILSKSCEQIMKWYKLYGEFLYFSINISPTQLINQQFLSHLKKTLKKYEFPTQYLEFEITEHALMTGNEETNKVLNYISKLGIKIALDDFGKAYSSLSRLNNLPIDTLKIDKEFINDIKQEKQKIVLVDLIIKLAKELNMSVVAEGIEKPQQLKYLIAKKCYVGQGFLLSKPLNAHDFALLTYKDLSKNNVLLGN